MRLIITIIPILILFMFFTCKDSQPVDSYSESQKYPGIHQANTPIQLDGHGQELAWDEAIWYPLDHVWLGEKPTVEDFSGRFKLLWNSDNIYILAEITDDVILDLHENGLDRYWDDDCLEIFIDEDNSGGNHQYNHNAFAYHLAQNLRVTDMGLDSLPGYFDSHMQSAKVQQENLTTWEAGIKIFKDDYTFGANPRQLSIGDELGFMVAYCDNDSSEQRENFVGSIAIEGEDKNRGWIDAGVFNDWTLID